MEYFIVAIVSLLASGLTFFSGFGLGTILTPAFVFFMPLEMAIVCTAIVHFLNGIFKLTLIKQHIQFKILLTFGIPSIVAAFAGGFVLQSLSINNQTIELMFFNHLFSFQKLNVIVGFLLLFFALFDLLPIFKNLAFDKKFMVLGGFLSGFFGGLSGHQGAFRSAFLIKAGLEKQAFVATGTAISFFIDLTRLGVYAQLINQIKFDIPWMMISIACFAAFAGAFLGNKYLKKASNSKLQLIVGLSLIAISIFVIFS